MAGLGAFVETVKIYQEDNVCHHLWSFGNKLKIEVARIVEDLGIADYFCMVGPSICLNYLTKDARGEVSLAYRTLFNQEMISNGVLIPWISPSMSHSDAELGLTLAAMQSALVIYREALEHGIGRYLLGDSIKPVFRRYN